MVGAPLETYEYASHAPIADVAADPYALAVAPGGRAAGASEWWAASLAEGSPYHSSAGVAVADDTKPSQWARAQMPSHRTRWGPPEEDLPFRRFGSEETRLSGLHDMRAGQDSDAYESAADCFQRLSSQPWQRPLAAPASADDHRRARQRPAVDSFCELGSLERTWDAGLGFNYNTPRRMARDPFSLDIANPFEKQLPRMAALGAER